ncbi:cytochrome c oxidase assembly protein [Sphaerisporangium flaviroseum]|uniref:Cytochrome c oxidase assembly protein n=1 Tax=Sphaerisporangium flaviroseum TaxID=509199 RepID=A0ABP7HI66_9ACTN
MTSLRRRSAVLVLVAAFAASAVLVLAMWFGGGWPRPEIPGLPSPGALTTLGLPIVRVVHDICAIATVGILLAAVALADDAASRRQITHSAAPWALGWAASAAVTQILTLSDLLGLPVGEALESGFLPTFSVEVPQGQAFLLVTLTTLAIAVTATLPLGPWRRALLLALAIFAVLPPAYVGHSASAADHNIAVSSLMLHIAAVTVWVGGLFGLVTRLRGSRSPGMAVRRFSAIALCCYIAVGGSGLVNAWVRLGEPAELWGSRYGLLVLAKLAALVALGWFGVRHRRSTIAALETSAASRPFLRLATVEIALMACTVALAVALSRTPPPRAEAAHDQHELLGYSLPPFTPWRLLTEIRPDPLLILAVAGLGAAYLVGVWRLARRGEAWPLGRTVAALAGLLVLLFAAAGGVSAYGPAIFSMHALQYALLGTVGPALLALGAPLVPLQAAAPHLRRMTEGPTALRLTRPVVALALYAVPYLILYVTGLFESAQSSLAVRLVAEVVVAVTGMWFFSVALGLDPLPRPIGPVVRTRMLLGALVVQAWMALVFLTGPLQGQGWYDVLAIPWAPGGLADQRTAVVLGVGPATLAIVALLVLMAIWRRDARRRVTTQDAPDEATVARP